MAYKATRSFSGIVSMKKGDVRDIKDVEVAKDLLRAGYVIALEEEKPQESAEEEKPQESKPKTSKRTAKKKAEDGDLDG